MPLTTTNTYEVTMTKDGIKLVEHISATDIMAAYIAAKAIATADGWSLKAVKWFSTP